MRIMRLPSHPEFKLEGNSQAFRALWEIELERGESTAPRQHLDAEEVYCVLEGEGEIIVADKRREIARGEVIHVPPRLSHWLENPKAPLVRAITIESFVAEHPADPPRETVGHLEQAIQGLPQEIDEAQAIQSIVCLFDIGGKLSEQIEEALGLDSEEAVRALSSIERKIMAAVVEITRRYQGRAPKHHPRF